MMSGEIDKFIDVREASFSMVQAENHTVGNYFFTIIIRRDALFPKVSWTWLDLKEVVRTIMVYTHQPQQKSTVLFEKVGFHKNAQTKVQRDC